MTKMLESLATVHTHTHTHTHRYFYQRKIKSIILKIIYLFGKKYFYTNIYNFEKYYGRMKRYQRNKGHPLLN